MRAKFTQLLLSTGTIFFLLNAAFAGEITIGELSARIDDLENTLKNGNPGPSDPDFAENGYAVESTETLETIRRLTQRLEEMERKLSLIEAGQAPAPVLPPPQKSSHHDAKEDENPPSTEGLSQEDSILKLLEEASPSDSKSNPAQKKSEKEKIREEATKKAEETAPTLAKGGAEAQYNQASSLYEKGEYAQSERAFKHIIDTYPKDPIAKKAQYWLAESYFAQKKNADAKTAFVKAYQLNPKGPRAPDCLLKLGLVLASQKNKNGACTAWKKLEVDYPNMPKETKTALEGAKKKHGCK